MEKYYDFNSKDIPEILEVGGKALSLIKLKKGGFNVPDGSVLTVDFFKGWIDELKLLPDLNSIAPNQSTFKVFADKLKSKAKGLIFSEEQKAVVRTVLNNYEKRELFAVRSSSPEEDLSGASFAGGYETILGVTNQNIYDAIKTAFVSCMDERVFVYKNQNGFDTKNIRIAVIIQEQIDSETSGVGFSLNPLTNCFDEVVIDANFGLGESVVSGIITPDEFVVDKNTKDIIEKKLGNKEQIIVLNSKGGTKTISGNREEFSMSEKQIGELLDLIIKVEKFYDFPVDIEWAFYKDELYLLQSRPITTYVPLPIEMQTTFGEQPILYIDGSLTKQGITTPISVLGCDCIGATQSVMFEDMMGKDVTLDTKGGMATTRGGRMYINISSSAKFQGLKKVIKGWKSVDISTADMLETLDLEKYIPKKLPEAMKGVLFGAIKNNMSTIKFLRKANKDPKAYKEWYQPFEDEFDEYLKKAATEKMTLLEAPRIVFKKYINLLNMMLPMTYAAEFARSKIEQMLKKTFVDGKEKMQYLERSLPDNVTIDMGMSMYQLSQRSEIKDKDFDIFIMMLKDGRFGKIFSTMWEEYIQTYGCRANNELDVGVKRQSENLKELFNQIKGMSEIDGDKSPAQIYNKSKELREKTYLEIVGELNGKSKKYLEKKYNILVELGGKREALKYWYVRSLAAIREIILKKADDLYKNKKIEAESDIFWLHLDQAAKAESKSAEVIKSWITENKKYYSQLSRVNNFPKLIDSRGLILTMPKTEAKEGEIAGQPISPGVVIGRVKVLHTPDEKPLLPGEILVTKATDPGWTPLFINASAILLEVGGLLQHGALVAREYGKPCIVGIEDAMAVFSDGQLVEVDAGKGIIKLLE